MFSPMGTSSQRSWAIFFFQAEDGIRDISVTGVQTCALPICLGVGPRVIGAVLGVAKAYTTRVGEGPLPTELVGDMGNRLRESGHEYGAVTGRPRRCGWDDAVAVRYSVRINGLDALALTKLDVLDGLDTIQICTAYQYGSRTLTEFPSD